MLLTIFNVFYILVAVAMVALILLQRGAGADAGSGFGSGASATVFGARGSASFLSRATAVLAALFFLLSLGMGMYLGRGETQQPTDDLGVMAGAAAPATTDKVTVPVPPAGDVPVAPTIIATDTPTAPKPTVPAPAVKDDGKPAGKANEPKKNN
jgi:preprotein translocase subunit SecG